MEKDIFESTEQINAPEPLEIDYFEVGETWADKHQREESRRIGRKIIWKCTRRRF